MEKAIYFESRGGLSKFEVPYLVCLFILYPYSEGTLVKWWIVWKKKRKGSLRLKCLFLDNKALLVKDMLQEEKPFGKKSFRKSMKRMEKEVRGGVRWLAKWGKSLGLGSWKNIRKGEDPVDDRVSLKVGNRRVKFWNDR